MDSMVKSFKDISVLSKNLAGGKGWMLAKMYQDGYPVPDGFIIFPSAFEGEELRKEAWIEIQDLLEKLRNNKNTKFAVRSSALAEDSTHTSFAGEFETVLNAHTNDEIKSAIYTVFESTESERVKTYSSIHGIEQKHQIAIIIMLMVQPEISGVLFTADPITGSYNHMVGNYVYGLGDQLVSGEANAHTFKLMRPKGKYEGPKEFKKYASILYKYASKLENELENQQDIEWAIENGKLYLLQTRPITTLNQSNIDTYSLNDSLNGDFLWSNTNVGEAMSGVFTPFSWSLIRDIDQEQSTVPGLYLFSGNICGRLYSNVSMLLSIYPAFGKDPKPILKKLGDIFGQFPEEVSIPIYPFAPFGLLKEMYPKVKNTLKKLNRNSKLSKQFLQDTPEWCKDMSIRIKDINTKEQLISLWEKELWPYNLKAFWVANSQARKFEKIFSLNQKLIELVGIEDANALLSNMRGDYELASLGPVLGVSKIIKGEMSRKEYLEKYGHRSPDEFELSLADPSEDFSWLDKQIEGFKEFNINIDELLEKQELQYQDAWERFKRKYPNKTKSISKKLLDAAEGSRLRETFRSEWTRVFRINRTFALKVGELMGIGEDIFFLYIKDVLNLLSGNDAAIKFIDARKTNYNEYKKLPLFPSIIRGRFDPHQWLAEPNRRVDFYDPTIPIDTSKSEILKGFAGAAGRVEGNVRIILKPEDAEMLIPGEILVASTTNVGWTPLFPKARAIITDIGAPLSHAAIVARELGIPAVVGCGNVTSRLKTGDKVIVDGGQGIVQILEE